MQLTSSWLGRSRTGSMSAGIRGARVSSDAEPVSIYDWAVTENLQPEPITVEIWRRLPEEFCRQVELVNGQVARCEHPSRVHQAAATRIAAMLDAAAEGYMERNPGTCLDTSSDFDVLLWEIPAATIRSPDAALFLLLARLAIRRPRPVHRRSCTRPHPGLLPPLPHSHPRAGEQRYRCTHQDRHQLDPSDPPRPHLTEVSLGPRRSCGNGLLMHVR